MIPVWPAELPQYVLSAGFNEQLGDGRLRTSMETGPQKVRRRFSSVARPVSASFRVTINQKARLRRFWEEDTKGGSLPFLIRNVVEDGARLTNNAGLRITNNAGVRVRLVSHWLVMWGDQPPAFTTPDRGLSYVASTPMVIMP